MNSLDRLGGIPVYRDPQVPAGVAVLDTDDTGVHITGIRAAGTTFTFTPAQQQQIRAHYAAMNERAAQVLAYWDRLCIRIGLRPPRE